MRTSKTRFRASLGPPSGRGAGVRGLEGPGHQPRAVAEAGAADVVAAEEGPAAAAVEEGGSAGDQGAPVVQETVQGWG